jgi:Leucine-rich repeat (LRR) protein
VTLDYIEKQDAGAIEELAAGRQIVNMSYVRARWQGLIGIFTEDRRVTAITAPACKLERVPDSIGRLDRLARLDLSRNPELSELPESLGMLPALRELYLYESGISELPPLAGTALEVLDLNRTDLASVPALDRLPLAFLYLESCGQVALPRLPPSLRYLNISHNPLGTLEVEVGELESLVELRAENIHLNETPLALHRLGKLREVQLRQNGFRDLPPLGHELEVLGLRDCIFTELPASLAGHPSLSRIDARGNFIDTVPPAVAELPMLRKLDLRWNRLREPMDWYPGLIRRGCLVYT